MWRVEERIVEVPMELCKVWDDTTERWRVDAGGLWPVYGQWERAVYTGGWGRAVGAG